MQRVSRLLTARLVGEPNQMERMSAGVAKRVFILPWLNISPIGLDEESRLVRKSEPTPAALG